jgi:hypothetical protein
MFSAWCRRGRGKVAFIITQALSCTRGLGLRVYLSVRIGVALLFENLAEQGKPVPIPSVFKKFRQKSTKIRKIRSKRTEDDGGTVKTENTEMRPVSLINRPVFLKTGVASSGRFLSKTG